MSVAQIYDFEGIVETAAKQVLSGLDLTAFTTQDDPTFDRPRPRVEMLYSHGSGLDQFVVVINGQNVALFPEAATGKTPRELFYLRRESAWNFSMQFDCLTAANMKEHAEYRVAVRAALAEFWQLINAKLERHTVQLARDGGNSEVMVSKDKGYYKTEMTFAGTISVQADAWAALVTD